MDNNVVKAATVMVPVDLLEKSICRAKLDLGDYLQQESLLRDLNECSQ